MKAIVMFLLLAVLVNSGSGSPAPAAALSKTRASYSGRRVAADRENCPETGDNRPPNRVNTTAKVAALRAAMRNAIFNGTTGQIHAYIILISDSHGTSGSDYDKRVTYISGFSGSSGFAIVTETEAALWTDGRYYLQGENQMDCDWILMKQGESETPTGPQWLADVLSNQAGAVAGVYPNYISIDTWKSYAEQFEGSDIQIVAVDGQDLVDKIWTESDRPPQPKNDIFIHELKFAGETWQEKLRKVRKEIEDKSIEILVVSILEEAAWLFNLRGTDRTSSLFYGYAIITASYSRLYVNNGTVNEAVRQHLGLAGGNQTICGAAELNCTSVYPYDTIMDAIRTLNPAGKIWVDPTSSYAVFSAALTAVHVEEESGTLHDSSKNIYYESNHQVFSKFSGHFQERVYRERSPIALMKSIKNPKESENFFNCIMRDSAAVVEFAAFMEAEMTAGNKKGWTEITAADELGEIRRKYENFRGLSFETISAVGPNAAVIHYRAVPETNAILTTNDLYLLDSGGQYDDGTTDVTRTFHYGTPTKTEKVAYTRVLMGAIDMAMTVWPEGLYGSDLDVRARTPLWQMGMNYNHGTGHGIGYFLSVHEGPGRINVGFSNTHSPLYAGMFFSDEPGYYEDGKFGIRLETLVGVVKMNFTNSFEGKQYLGFRPATLVPFEPKLIDADMLSADQVKWLDDYHQICKQEVGQYLLKNNKNQAYDWLTQRTNRISFAIVTTSSRLVTAAMQILAIIYCH